MKYDWGQIWAKSDKPFQRCDLLSETVLSHIWITEKVLCFSRKFNESISLRHYFQKIYSDFCEKIWFETFFNLKTSHWSYVQLYHDKVDEQRYFWIIYIWYINISLPLALWLSNLLVHMWKFNVQKIIATVYYQQNKLIWSKYRSNFPHLQI